MPGLWALMLLTLLLAHFVADFVLQSREIAKTKSSNWWSLFNHLVIIFACFLPWGWQFALANAFIHGVIDKNIWTAYKYIRRNENIGTFKYWEDHLFYCTIGFDQFLHVATLVLLAERFLV